MIKSYRIEMSRDGLPSLTYFKKEGTKIASSMEQPVLVSINICNLKYFNEIYGTDEGDRLIQYMVRFFCFDDPDCAIAAKSYVDHILILREGHHASREELLSTYETLSDLFVYEVSQKYNRARTHIECGLYVVEPHVSFLDAQDNARYARRSIKGSYLTTVAFYNEGLRRRSMEKACVIPNFETALEENRIVVLLQPKYSVQQKRIIGAEALSRFCDSEGKMISPALFVPVLEDASIVSQLDLAVIRQIVPLQRRWMDEGRELFPISVNLSRMDLLEPGFIERVDAIVEASGIPKWCLEFELTETVVVENLSEIVMRMKLLRAKGYRIAIDDFGSGYNSLYVLGMIPANVIKFDRGFVLHSIQNQVGLTILSNLVETFREISFEVLCEGVETKEEENAIVGCGCDIIQGYLCDKPIPIPVFEEKYVSSGMRFSSDMAAEC